MMRAMHSVPDMGSALAPLASYENGKLKELVEDDSKVEEYVKTLSQSKFFVESKEEKMTQNKSLAEYNLSIQPAFERGKEDLKELSKQISDLCQIVQEKESQVRQVRGSMSEETALALLQTAAAESEDDSEKVADLFYQKEMEVEDFLEKFQDTRKRMHLRRVKADKMSEILSQRNSRPSSGVPRRAAPLPPYPVGPTFPFKK